MAFCFEISKAISYIVDVNQLLKLQHNEYSKQDQRNTSSLQYYPQ